VIQNVWSKEVEGCLSRHPGVVDTAVIGLPDSMYEEQVVAVVVPSAAGSAELAAELTAFVRANLAGYNTPAGALRGRVPADGGGQDPAERAAGAVRHEVDPSP
jgi:acyl-CoA synthetase (AMP-forming)/AMP-acid ligase II